MNRPGIYIHPTPNMNGPYNPYEEHDDMEELKDAARNLAAAVTAGRAAYDTMNDLEAEIRVLKRKGSADQIEEAQGLRDAAQDEWLRQHNIKSEVAKEFKRIILDECGLDLNDTWMKGAL